MRIVWPCSVCATTSSCPGADIPIVKNRCSDIEWALSGKVVDSESSKTVAPSRKSTPCFLRLAAALPGSHVKITEPSIRVTRMLDGPPYRRSASAAAPRDRNGYRLQAAVRWRSTERPRSSDGSTGFARPMCRTLRGRSTHRRCSPRRGRWPARATSRPCCPRRRRWRG